MPRIAAITTIKKKMPMKQRNKTIIHPRIVSPTGSSGLTPLIICAIPSIRWARPKSKVNQLIKAEIRAITIFKKIGAFSMGSFMLNYV